MSRHQRLFRRLLKLFPAEFRGDFGDEMSAVFDEERREAARGGPGSVLRLWWRTLCGVAATAAREHGDQLRQDVAYGIRGLLRSPAFAATAVLTLALGIGANTAVFTLVDAVLLRPLPYDTPSRLVWVHGSFSGGDGARVSPPDFQDYRDRSRSFSVFAAMFPLPYTISGAAEPERVAGALVSADFFVATGMPPLLGRTFLAADAADVNRATTVVISYGLWQRRFGARGDIVGQRLIVNGRPSTIIGVMPRSFALPRDAELWIPCTMRGPDMDVRAAHFLIPIGRLKDGVRPEQAQADVNSIAAALAREHPSTNTGWRLRLVPLPQQIASESRPTLVLVSAAVALVLLIACVNVANLLLARGSARARELAVRAALGAGRGRLGRQLMTEALLVSAIGAAAGVAVAYGSLSALASAAPADLATVSGVHIDARVLAFTIGVAIATGLVFGILPARRAARAEASDLLRPAPGNAHARRGRLGRVLVGAELALATTLVIATGLLLKTVNSISRVDPGFDPGHLTTFQVAVPTALDDQAVQQFFDAFVQRIEALPGIEHAALASEVPLSDQHSDAFFRVDGVPLTDANDRPTANLRRVTADYFATLGVPLLRGRRFTAAEARGDAPVVAINEAMARRYVPGDPLGRRLLVERFPNERAYEIVALVRDIRHDALDAAPAPEMYIPTQTFWTPNVLIRSRLTPAAILATVRPELRRLDPTVPISEVTAYEDRVRHSFDAQRFRTELLIAFSLVAIALSAVGVYGLATYSVSQRTREIGVRLALGASTRTVLGGELTAALRLAAAGVGGGVVAAAALSQAMRALLFNVSATDPGTIGATAALLCGVTMVATFTAARRVARIDPLLALRAE